VNQLDAADRAQHVTDAAYRKLRWRAVRFLAPVGAMCGLLVAVGFGIVWLLAVTFGVWGVFFSMAIGTALAVRDAWRAPEDFVGRWRL